MKIANYAFAIVFLYAAIIQYNDPDPAYWIMVYAGTAIIALSVAVGRFNRFWTGVVIGGLVAGLLINAGGFLLFLKSRNYAQILGDMAGSAHIEETREFLGLFLALALMIFYVAKNNDQN